MSLTPTCCVCWEVTTIESKTSCSHFLCQECVSKICTTKCPICRQDPIQNIYVTEEILKEIKKKHEIQKASLINEFSYTNNDFYNQNRAELIIGENFRATRYNILDSVRISNFSYNEEDSLIFNKQII